MKKSSISVTAALVIFLINAQAENPDDANGDKAKSVELLKTTLSQSMKDPESAKYQNLQIYKTIAVINNVKQDTGMYTLCGEVNAKNSYGGYVGYKPFFVILLRGEGGKRLNPDAVSQIGEPDDSNFAKSFKGWCKENGEFYMRTK